MSTATEIVAVLSGIKVSYRRVDCSVSAAVLASGLSIAVAPDAEVVLIDVGPAERLPLLLARTSLGDLLLGRHLDARLRVLPARDAGVRSSAIDAVCAARAVGCRRRDRHSKGRHKPSQGDPCLNHRFSPSNPGAATACQNEAQQAAAQHQQYRQQGGCKADAGRKCLILGRCAPGWSGNWLTARSGLDG